MYQCLCAVGRSHAGNRHYTHSVTYDHCDFPEFAIFCVHQTSAYMLAKQWINFLHKLLSGSHQSYLCLLFQECRAHDHRRKKSWSSLQLNCWRSELVITVMTVRQLQFTNLLALKCVWPKSTMWNFGTFAVLLRSGGNEGVASEFLCSHTVRRIAYLNLLTRAL